MSRHLQQIAVTPFGEYAEENKALPIRCDTPTTRNSAWMGHVMRDYRAHASGCPDVSIVHAPSSRRPLGIFASPTRPSPELRCYSIAVSRYCRGGSIPPGGPDMQLFPATNTREERAGAGCTRTVDCGHVCTLQVLYPLSPTRLLVLSPGLPSD